MIRQYTKPGRMHQCTGIDNQDFSAFLENDHYFFAAIADGATACRHSAQGAQIACRTALDYAQAHMVHLWQFSQEKIAYLLLEQIRTALTRHANALGHRPEDYASTLSLCCYQKSQGKLLLFQLGDSPILYLPQGSGAGISLMPTFHPGGCPLTMTRDGYKAARVLQLSSLEAGRLLLCTDGIPTVCTQQTLCTLDPQALSGLLDAAENQDDCSFISVSLHQLRK